MVRVLQSRGDTMCDTGAFCHDGVSWQGAAAAGVVLLEGCGLCGHTRGCAPRMCSVRVTCPVCAAAGPAPAPAIRGV